MGTVPANDLSVESDLIDLSGIPMTTLRMLGGVELRRSLARAVERTARITVIVRSGDGIDGGGERVD